MGGPENGDGQGGNGAYRRIGERLQPPYDSRMATRPPQITAQGDEQESAAGGFDARLSAIVSIAADAIIAIDASQLITLFNNGAEKIFGYSATEVIGQPLEILLPEAVRRPHAEHIRQFAESATNARRMGERSAISGRRKSGEIFPAEASISKAKVDGEWMFTVILRDVTEHKRTEAALQFLAEAGKDLNRSLDFDETVERAAHAAVPVLADCCVIDILNEDGQLISFSVSASSPDEGERLRAERELRTLRPAARELLHLTRQRNAALVLPSQATADLAQAGVEPNIVRSMTDVPVRSLMMFPLALRSQLFGVMTLLITHSQRRYDDGYVVLAGELASRIAHAIDNARLYQKSRQAVAVRDEVVAIVSHDLRNPLSVVKMCASTLSVEPLPDAATVTDLARTVHQSAEWMLTIIQDLLDVAHLESGRLTLRHERASTAAVIEKVVELHAPLANERDLDLTSDVPVDVPSISMDTARIGQVLANLIGNSLKFTEPGGRVTVSARVSGDDRVVVSVADTGRGISADDLPRLFDRFWQASRGDLKRGTGLGLAIAKGIVEAHDGRIWVESVEGKGATFSFSLPV
jgi:PAS domain S-box-containing protein